MSPAHHPGIARASLQLDERLGQGGQGTVYRVLNKRINESADAWTVAYKEYDASLLAEVNGSTLRAMVAMLESLDAADGRWLCEKTAWPAAVVEDNGQVRGFLMRAVPDRFRIRLPGLAAANAGLSRLATIEFLLNDDAYVARIGLTVSDQDRIALLADLADTLTRLHRLGIAVGDLSPKNLLFQLGPRPECFLIDCDAMCLRGASVLPQAETPDWQLPAGEQKATREGDMHKFGLLAARLFARDQSSTNTDALGALDPRLERLARASLDLEPYRRPSPVAWTEALAAAAPKASAVPAGAGTTSTTAAAAVTATPSPVNAAGPGHAGTTTTTTAGGSGTSTGTAPPAAATVNPDPGAGLRIGLHVLAGIGLFAAYNGMPWIKALQDGTTVPFHPANTLTLSLFAKGFWTAVVGALFALDDEIGSNAFAALLGAVSFGCLVAGYQRLENDFGSAALSPQPGLVISCLAAAAVVTVGLWRCAVVSRARNP